MEDVVDGRCEVLGTLGQLIRNAGWRNLIHLTVVLSIVVKELVLGHHLSNGEHHTL